MPISPSVVRQIRSAASPVQAMDSATLGEKIYPPEAGEGYTADYDIELWGWSGNVDPTPASILITAQRPPSDGSYVHLVEAFAGVGLRPYTPAQLRVLRQGGNHLASWVRRTRVGGDSWSGLDVPLGEARELYLVRVYAGAVLKREETVGAAAWTYGAALRASDGVAQSYEIHVAQVSETFGTGPFARISVNV